MLTTLSISVLRMTEVFRYETRFTVELRPLSIAVPTINQASCYQTSSLPSFRRSISPSRPLPRCLVTEQVCRQINAIVHSRHIPKLRWLVAEQVYHQIADFFHYRPDHGHYRRISARNVICCRSTAILSHCPDNRRCTAITVGLPRLPLVPAISTGFRFPLDDYPGTTS